MPKSEAWHRRTRLRISGGRAGRCGEIRREGLDEILVGGFQYFLFSPLPGEMIQFD